MCTASLISLPGGGRRMVFNRDESRARMRSEGLRVVETGGASGSRAVMPLDPESNGTWIAASDAGLVVALLNCNPQAYPGKGAVSRGRLVRELIKCGSAAEACASFGKLSTGSFAPFRLVAFDLSSGGECVWTGERLNLGLVESGAPFMATSSSLGDQIVWEARRAKFGEMVGASAGSAEAQDAFHAWRCAEAGYLGVLMTRADARTMSRTVVTLMEGSVTMRVEMLGEDLEVETNAAENSELTLTVQRSPQLV
jgi:hypothetical protein